MGAIAKARADMAARPAQDTFRGLLESQWGKISSVMPRRMSPDRLFQLAVSSYHQTPGLAECSPVSVLSCVMKCAALGLEPSAVDGLGRAYILPFFNSKTKQREATLIIGYKGLLDLARRSGEIESISSRPVYLGDYFEYEYGLDDTLRHRPADVEHAPENLTHVYCVAKFKDGGHYIDVMTRTEVEQVRKRSKSPDFGPWVTDFEAMACKSVIRRASKYWPLSVEGQQAIAADETTPAIPAIGFAGDEPAPAMAAGEAGEAADEATGVAADGR